jgi:hypothetical protein
MEASAQGSRIALFTAERNAEMREQLLVIRSTMTAKATVPAHRLSSRAQARDLAQHGGSHALVWTIILNREVLHAKAFGFGMT